jgi:hypothetical protein
MATAARFSAGAGPLSGNRVKSAQRSAIFRRVASSNGRAMPLDYTTLPIDETTLKFSNCFQQAGSAGNDR